MFRTILLLDAARRTAVLDLTEHLRRCAVESGLSEGLMTVHALDPGFRLAVEEHNPSPSRGRGAPIPFLALPAAPASPLRDAFLLEIAGGDLCSTGRVRLVNLDAADRPGRVLVRAGTPSETCGPEPGRWERVFTRVSLEQ